MSGYEARQNFMVSTFSEIAFEHFQKIREDYQNILTFDKMCGEVIEIEHEIQCNYVITITFSAMAL